MVRDIPTVYPEDLFQDFFLYIAKDNFKKLGQYKGTGSKEGYIGRILKNFIYDRIKVDKKRDPEPLVSFTANNSQMIGEAIEATYNALKPKQALIFDITYNEKKRAEWIARTLNIKLSYVYETNRKAREILLIELEKRGIDIKRFFKNKKPNF